MMSPDILSRVDPRIKDRADKLAAEKKCPECGADMTHLDPVGHSLYHWPANLEVRIEHANALYLRSKLESMPSPTE